MIWQGMPWSDAGDFDADGVANGDDAFAYRLLGGAEARVDVVVAALRDPDTTGATLVMLQDAAGSRGIAIEYQTTTLPSFTLWKNTDTEEDAYRSNVEEQIVHLPGE